MNPTYMETLKVLERHTDKWLISEEIASIGKMLGLWKHIQVNTVCKNINHYLKNKLGKDVASRQREGQKCYEYRLNISPSEGTEVLSGSDVKKEQKRAGFGVKMSSQAKEHHFSETSADKECSNKDCKQSGFYSPGRKTCSRCGGRMVEV